MVSKLALAGTVLKKQHNYQRLFEQFDPIKIAQFDDGKMQSLLQQPGIIRNKLKVESIVRNARAFNCLKDKGVCFSDFLWDFVDGRTVVNSWTEISQVPTFTKVSLHMSKVLKDHGFTFVGETIVYAFMQAVGMVNDHLVDCHCYQACCEVARR